MTRIWENSPQPSWGCEEFLHCCLGVSSTLQNVAAVTRTYWNLPGLTETFQTLQRSDAASSHRIAQYAEYRKNRQKLALVVEVVVRDDVPEPPEKADIPPSCPFVKRVGDRNSDDGGRVRVLDPEDDARPLVLHDTGNAPGEPMSIWQHQTAITPHAWHSAHNLPRTGWFYVYPLFLLFFHVQGPMGKERLGSEKKMTVVTARFDGTTGKMAPQNGFGTTGKMALQNGFGNGFPDVGWKFEGYTYHDDDDDGGDGRAGANPLWCLAA
ncbi:hypothetical protein FKP32DRAFT_1600227 [Trametes sanguinea]|nr:hypothetical protein FKP32DRAFT_1600227 [Trametes sanguinea]